MMAFGLILASLLAAFAGFAFIALTQPINRQRVPGCAEHGLRARVARRRRWSGALLIAVSVAAPVVLSGPSFGFPLAVLLLSVSGYGVMAALAWVPRIFGKRREQSSRCAD